MEKVELRAKFRDRRAALSDRPQLEAQTVKRLSDWLDTLTDGETRGLNWAAYWPRPEELSLVALFRARPEINWIFPKVKGQDLEMWRPPSWETMKPGAYGIPEPGADGVLVPKSELDGVFVPLIAFDTKGHRLGSGKGFYDRYLRGLNVPKVGVAFECQKHEGLLPAEAHDQPLDQVVTESRTYLAKKI